MKKLSRWLLVLVAVALIVAVADATVFTDSRTTARLLPGNSISLSIWGNTTICDKLGWYTKFGNADSCTWRAYYSDDWVNWVLIDSTVVNVAPNNSYIHSSPDYGATASRQLVHVATSGANNTVHFDGFIYPMIYASVTNRAKVDTAAFTITLKCGTEGN